MIVAIMQPYFFPYIGYFQLMRAAEEFILLDDVQYIRHGWVNRNRILKPAESWQYIVVPLRAHSHGALIREMMTNNDKGWRELIFRQLAHYRKIARHYTGTIALVEQALSIESDNLAAINLHSLSVVANYIGIKIPIRLSSSMDFNYAHITDPGDWALTISEQRNASTYINPYDGKELFDRAAFSEASIKLQFLKPELLPYSQRRKIFEPALSIIDVLMFNGRERVKEMLNGEIIDR